MLFSDIHNKCSYSINIVVQYAFQLFYIYKGYTILFCIRYIKINTWCIHLT